MKIAESTLSEKLRNGNLSAEQRLSCGVLKHVTSRWGMLILVALREGTRRFSDLRRKMDGVSEKILAQSLQTLEQDGFIDHVSYPVVPPRVEYSPTPLGLQVSEKVAALANQIENNLPAVLANHRKRKRIIPCSPATGEMSPDNGWCLIRVTDQLRFVAPISTAPPRRCTRIAAGALSGLPVGPGLQP